MGAFKPIWTPVDSGESIIEAFGGLDLDYINERYRIYDPALGRLVEKPWADIVNNRSLPAGRTYWDANGVLQTAAADAPVIEYDPVTGVKLGNRIWGSYTNLHPGSELFNPDNLYSGGVSYEILAGAGPGAAACLKMIATAGGGEHRRASITLSIASGTAYTASFALKENTHRYVQFLFSSTGSWGGLLACSAKIDTRTGTVVAGTSIFSISALDIGDGWFEYFLTATATGGVGNSGFSIGLSNSMTLEGGLSTFAAAGTEAVLIAKVGFKVGATKQPHIVTPTNAAVTIPAESQIIDGQNFLDLWNAAEITAYVDAKAQQGDFSRLLSFSDGGSGNELRFQRNSGGQLIWRIEGGNTATLITSGVSWEVFSKAAGTYRSGSNIRLRVDGQASANSSINSDFTVQPSQLGVASTASGVSPANVHIRRIILFRKALPDSPLQRITQL